MRTLTEDRALDLLKSCFGTSSGAYLWEGLQNIEWSQENLLCEDAYDVIFDPRGDTMAARLAAARHFGRDDAPLGYRMTRAELAEMSRQRWVSDADFYVIGCDGALRALRTHEDPDLQYGFWIPVAKRG